MNVTTAEEDHVSVSISASRKSPFSALMTVGTIAVLVAGSLVLAAASADAGSGRCRGVRATIVGTAGNDDIEGTSRRDVIQGRGGHDEIEGHRGNDLICGGAGRDDLEGNRGDDRLFGNRGNDELEGGRGGDLLNGGRGFDEGDGDAGVDVCRRIEDSESCN
jgi:Ca2+-binding RTX toxin-like protein